VKASFRFVVFLITILAFNQVLAQDSGGGYHVPVYSWLKSIYTDPAVVQSGSLLSEPFQKKGNIYPGIIFLSQQKIFLGNTSQKIKTVFSVRDSLISINDFSKALRRAEEEKMISFDSSIFSDKKVHVLGVIYLNGVYKTGTVL